MKILRTVKEIQAYTKVVKAEGKTIGLVPTMGALHTGHLSLVRAARETTDIVIVSVFVNPTQFGPGEDYEAYPRDFSADSDKLVAAGVDAVFHPAPAEMYPEGYATYVNIEGALTEKLCGARRPGHFRGVATVVTKLLHLSGADKAFFGQKDAQQVVVIRRVVADLNLSTEIVMTPIVREGDGLALSSRNRYLSAEERGAALVLSRSLREAEAAFAGGEKDAAALKALVTTTLMKEPLAVIDYVELYSFPAFRPVKRLEEPALLAIAVKIGQTRLIDNVILGGIKECC